MFILNDEDTLKETKAVLMSKQINRHAWDNIQLSGHPVTAAF
jgi:hypothetical protein